MKDLPLAALWLAAIVIMAYTCAEVVIAFPGSWGGVFVLAYGILFSAMVLPVANGFRTAQKANRRDRLAEAIERQESTRQRRTE